MVPHHVTRLLAATAAVLGLCAALPGNVAQAQRNAEDDVLFEKERPGRRGRRSPDPAELRRRIEELKAEDPEDPRIERLERMLEHMESRPGEGGGRHFEGGPGRQEPPQFTREQIRAFVEEHPELQEIKPWKRGAGRKQGPGPRRHFGALMAIMEAFDSGDTERGELMIQSAVLQYRIRETLRSTRRAADNGDAAGAEVRLRELVLQQVRLDHQIKGMELDRLRQRLERQSRKHDDQGQHLERVAERRVRALLKGRNRGQRRQRGSQEPQDPPDE